MFATIRNSKIVHIIFGGNVILIAKIIEWRKFVRYAFKPELATDKNEHKINKHQISNTTKSNQNQEQNKKPDTTPEKKPKKKFGFRDRRIVEYENRIRQYSSRDKVFRYFATVRLATPTGTQVHMTPEDFFRSIYPGLKQPDGLGLDHYRNATDSDINLEKYRFFNKLGSDGLITFADFVFLLTILCTSPRTFEIAFQMFDVSGKGYIDINEFQKVATLARLNSRISGRRHLDDKTDNSFKAVSSGLTAYFFKDNRLTIKEFLKFQRHLMNEILSMEFDRHQRNSMGNISEVAFADMILVYAGYPPSIVNAKLKRVRKKYHSTKSVGISKRDYQDFFHFLTNINDISMALSFHRLAGSPIDQSTLKQVAQTVAGLALSDHLCNVVFTIFDDNLDGQLSNREFVAVMKRRMNRGLDTPKDIGFIRLFFTIIKCTSEMCHSYLN